MAGHVSHAHSHLITSGIDPDITREQRPNIKEELKVTAVSKRRYKQSSRVFQLKASEKKGPRNITINVICDDSVRLNVDLSSYFRTVATCALIFIHFLNFIALSK